ncbi:MAG: aldo/keto reductase [Alphaproteobacteria bacterium]|nr:aldo/keto reductase [Alphaproteobacteria bacterium]
MNPPVARLGLGGAALGVLFEPVGEAQALATVDAAWEAGIRIFDTSPLYGGGLSEERFGRALSRRPREAYFLSTKTGVSRPYGQAAAPPGGARRAADVWDYSADATRRSVAASLTRLAANRVDLVHLHDVERRTDAAMTAYPELERLRAAGTIGGIGIGANTVDAPLELMARARFDAVLVAGRYSLLDQSMLRLAKTAEQAGTRLIVGGVFNSGILATGARPGATFHYDPAPPEVLERVRAIEALCARYQVPLRAAALQFPLAHPLVHALLLGARHPAELRDCLSMLAVPIPSAFWRDLQRDGHVDRGCPLP